VPFILKAGAKVRNLSQFYASGVKNSPKYLFFSALIPIFAPKNVSGCFFASTFSILGVDWI
jgi:hypothetical protein